MSADTVCRVCLVINLKLHGVRNDLQNVYERLLGEKYNKVGYPISMCYICLSVLQKCLRFMVTAQDTNKIFKQWCTKQNEVKVAKPLSRYSITKVELLSMGSQHVSLNHEIKKEAEDLKQKEVEPAVDINLTIQSTENSLEEDIKIEELDLEPDYIECGTDDDIESAEVDEQHNNDSLLIDRTEPLFNNNKVIAERNSFVSNVDTTTRNKTIPQNNIDDSEKYQDTEITNECQSEIAKNDALQLLSGLKVPYNVNTQIKMEEQHESGTDDIYPMEVTNIKNNVNTEVLKSNNKKQSKVKSDAKNKLKQDAKKYAVCNECNYKCLKKSLIGHLRTHSGEKPFSCNFCKYTCTQKSNLRKHELRKHSGEKPFLCEFCEFRCVQKSDLRIHSKIHPKTYADDKPFSCEFCKFKCARRSYLKKHLIIHSDEKPLSCNFCEYRCAKKSNMADHVRRHTGDKPFSCKLCNFKSAQKSYLKIHLRKHTGEKPFSCKFCEYRCVKKTHLTEHLRIHTGEKPFSCKFCKHRCARSSDLNKHLMNSHSDEKTFSCKRI